ncbi:MAG: alpha-N-arabinofuranosidase, partial [Defluviitaleaceae bacterium]|nr:alpha-N-arabinofuranosidase [Defluviitaleaceae bacterium]
YGGTLVSIGDVFLDGRTDKTALNYMGNTHGSLVQVKNQWYVFYHRQTNLHQFSRQACAEKIFIESDGTIKQAEITSCGLNNGALLGKGKYPARIACNLRAAVGCSFYSFNDKQEKAGDPYFTQDLPDCDPNPQTLPVQYIANLQNGAMAGFKYFQFDGENGKISVKVRGKAVGKIFIATKLNEKCDNGEVAGCFNKAKDIVAEIAVDVDSAEDWVEFSADLAVSVGQQALYFVFEIDGVLEFLEFGLE